jgi:acetyl esterase/lipase
MRRLAVFALLFAAVLSNAQERIKDVIYLKQGGAAFTLDVFKPKTPNGKAVVWLVSGGWVSDHSQINPDPAKFLTDQGFTVFEVVHGAQPRYIIPEIIKQLQHAIRFVRANAKTYGIEPNEIGVTGISSGGHLSLMLAGLGDDGDPSAKDPVDQASSKVNAVVAFMPPTDFLDWGAKDTMTIKDPKLAPFLPAFGIKPGATDADIKELARSDSPIYLVKAGFPPTLLVQGDKDTLVPEQQSQLLDSTFETDKVVHKLIIVPGGGHDLTTVLGGLQAALQWFKDHLGPAPAGG